MEINLGLIISNDGLTFREPVAGYPFIPRGCEKSDWKTLRLFQAPAFVNHGDTTYIWYGGASNPNQDAFPHVEHHAEVGLATFPQDRFGCLTPTDNHAELISQILPATKSGFQLWINVDGVDRGTGLRVELLDGDFQSLSGHSDNQAALVTEAGLRVPVKWASGATANIQQPCRIRVSTTGDNAKDIKLYAIYVGPIA